MTETHPQDAGTPPQRDGIDTQHLRDYTELRRSVADRKVAGVAGGLGRHLNIDPTILRVAFVVLCFFGGAGFLLYGVLWLFVPEEGRDQGVIHSSPGVRNTVLLVVAVLGGLLVLGDSVGGFGFPWPLAIVALVVAVILMNRDRKVNESTAPPPPGSSPGSSSGTGTVTDPATTGSTATGETPTAPYSYGPPPAWTPPAPPAYSPPPPAVDRGPKLFWITVAVLAIALGSLGMYDVLGGAVAEAAYPALALVVIGGMLVLAAWYGRGGGLILLGVIATLALAAASLAPGIEGGRADRFTPRSAAFVQDSYRVPAGEIVLDLTEVRDLEALDGRTIRMSANAGELIVLLPDSLDASVTADISVAGEANVGGETSEGTNVALAREIDGGIDVPKIELDLDLAVGSIVVRQS